jgi:hypothetical protein
MSGFNNTTPWFPSTSGNDPAATQSALNGLEKELLTIVDGYRESEQSWLEALNELKRLGMKKVPKLWSVTAP